MSGRGSGSSYAVLGAGAWGSALAIHMARRAGSVRLWAREPEVADEISRKRRNTLFLPGFSFPDSVGVTSDLSTAVRGASRVLVVVPSQHCRGVLRRASAALEPGATLIMAAKGIETDTLALMTAVAAVEAAGRASAVLSGPSFAAEVARGDPTAVVIASSDSDLARCLQDEISGESLRLYTNSDPVGVQLAGALKNVFAVAAGAIAGLGLGHNTVAALITRALVEMRRLGVAAGGRTETFDGLAGVGDLVLTCTGALSRNRRLGEALGRGMTLEEALAGATQVAEGVATSLSARDLAQRHGVEMPIVEQVHAVLHRGRSPREAITELMARRLKSELDG